MSKTIWFVELTSEDKRVTFADGVGFNRREDLLASLSRRGYDMVSYSSYKQAEKDSAYGRMTARIMSMEIF